MEVGGTELGRGLDVGGATRWGLKGQCGCSLGMNGGRGLGVGVAMWWAWLVWAWCLGLELGTRSLGPLGLQHPWGHQPLRP